MKELTHKMGNMISKRTKTGNVVVSIEESQYYYLPFNKTVLDLCDNKVKDQFIKAIERRVRRSKRYKAYVNYLKTECKLDRCSVFGNIRSEKGQKTKIEMHHGPIFTLYDIVSIVLEKYLRNKDLNINTFDIANEVLDLHRRKLIQTVMLSESVHKSMDNPKLAPFLSLDQTFGNLYGFLEEYHEYLSPTHIRNLKNYFINYKYNQENNQLNMFKPIFVKYNIKVIDNRKTGDKL